MMKSSLRLSVFSIVLGALSTFNFMSVGAELSSEEVFTHIYEDKIWGKDAQGKGSSGEGSSVQVTRAYRRFLQKFLNDHQVRSVVDVGCGDWRFSRHIDWKGIDYWGYDVVKFIIDKNQSKHGASNIHFICANALEEDLPASDLLICKDVLQHLPLEDIFLFLSQIHKFKYCLITNDVDLKEKGRTNSEIARGGFHPIDLAKPPFCIEGVKIFSFQAGSTSKEVFLIDNSQSFHLKPNLRP